MLRIRLMLLLVALGFFGAQLQVLLPSERVVELEPAVASLWRRCLIGERQLLLESFRRYENRQV